MFTALTVTGPTTVWDQNDANLICDFTGLDNTDLSSVVWFKDTMNDQVYFYNSTTDTAEGVLTGRAGGALGVSVFTLTITSLTVGNSDGGNYYCQVTNTTGDSLTESIAVNVAGKYRDRQKTTVGHSK